jgi:hypothetical protein
MKLRNLLLIGIIASLLIPIVSAQNTTVAPKPTVYSSYHKGDSYQTVYSPTEISVPDGTDYPSIGIIYPQNESVISSNSTLNFMLTLKSPSKYYPITLLTVCYKPSWSSENITVDLREIVSLKFYSNNTLPFSISLVGIPEGKQSVTIYVTAFYEYETGTEYKEVHSQSSFLIFKYLYVYSNYYFLEGSSFTEFIVENSPTPDSDTYAESKDLLVYLLIILVAVVTLAIIAYFTIRRKSTSKQICQVVCIQRL